MVISITTGDGRVWLCVGARFDAAGVHRGHEGGVVIDCRTKESCHVF